MPTSSSSSPTDFRAATEVVIFDLDGVIADSEPLHQEAFARLFRQLGLDLSPLRDWHQYVGTADRPVMEKLVDGRPVPGSPSIDDLLVRKGALFLELVRERQPLFPPIPDLVRDLADRYVLAVASGSLRTAIAGVLELRELRKFFRSTLSVQDVGRGKPAPDLFLRTSERLGVAPSACVVIEDSVPGVTAARAAGMRVIAITNTTDADRLRAAEADAVVSDYGQIRNLLLGA